MSSVLSRATPAGWERLRFDRVVTRSKEAGQPSWEPLSVFLGDGVVPRSSRDDNHNQLGVDLSNYLAVRPGDIVFNKLRTWQGGLGVSRYRGIVSPAYFVCRPLAATDSRYFHYLLRSHVYLAELTRLSKFMPPSQFDISWDDLRTLPVYVPPLREQRAIADYLDTETARIDALIAKKRRMIGLLHEQAQSALLDAVGDWRTQPSRTLRQYGTNVLTGPFGTVLTASEYVEGGVPLVNPTHIRSGEIVPEPEVTVPEQVAARISRHRLSVGDVVMGRKGDVGRSAIISEREDLGRFFHGVFTSPLSTVLLVAVVLIFVSQTPLWAHAKARLARKDKA